VKQCSFCGKDKDETELLIRGPECYICSDCVVTCIQILHNHYKELANESLSRHQDPSQS